MNSGNLFAWFDLDQSLSKFPSNSRPRLFEPKFRACCESQLPSLRISGRRAKENWDQGIKTTNVLAKLLAFELVFQGSVFVFAVVDAKSLGI